MVKFSDHTNLMLSVFIKAAKKLGAPDPIEVAFNVCCNQYGKAGLMCGLIEKRFIRKSRPFFNVYPSVLSALQKTRLTIKPSQIPISIVHQLQTIGVRIPIGSPLAKETGFNSFILSVINEETMQNLKRQGCPDVFSMNGNSGIVCCATSEIEGGGVMFSSCPMNCAFDDIPNGELSETQRSKTNLVCRIALGVMMLAADPDYIKPVILKADEGKTTPIEERIARAKNRGVYGFTIGEEIERSPHFRRPHFGIRWTGKGGAIPRLVPIKGAIVGKEIMTTVPTGYED